jgi:hypothetical protein
MSAHLQHFWELVTFKKLPQTIEDINIIIQVEMMKFHSRAVVCKITPSDTTKYRFELFVGEKDTNYFCKTSRLLIKENSPIRKLVDLLITSNMHWGIETNLDGSYYLIASWKHWGE